MIVFRLSIRVRMVDPVIDGPELVIITRRMNEVDQANSFHRTMLIAARAAPQSIAS